VMSPSMAASTPVTPAGGVRKMATVRRILRTLAGRDGTGVLRRG
jgi:hypothetical protein